MSATGQTAFADEQISVFVKALQTASRALNDSDNDCAALAEIAVGAVKAGLEPIIAGSTPALFATRSERISGFVSAADTSVLAVAGSAQGWFILRLSASALDTLVGEALGGMPENKPVGQRVISRVELAVARVVIAQILKQLSDTLGELNISLDGAEFVVGTQADVLGRFPPDMQLSVVSMQIDGGSTLIEIAANDSVVEACRLHSSSANESAASPTQGKSQVMESGETAQEPLPSVKVGVSAVLCEQLIDLDEILEWSLDMPVLLDVTTSSRVQVVANDIPLYRAELGRMNGWMCVQIWDDIFDTESIMVGAPLVAER